MTFKLVRTNITVVMEEDRKKLNRKEITFLRETGISGKGICEGEPPLDLRSFRRDNRRLLLFFCEQGSAASRHLRSLHRRFQRAPFRACPDGGGTSRDCDDNEIQIIRYLSAHREECIILMEKSAGSCYEHFHEEAAAMMQESFRRYYRKYLGAEPDPELIRILASMRLHGYLELVHGDYTMKERLFLARAIGIHADAGTLSLIQYLKEENDAHR